LYGYIPSYPEEFAADCALDGIAVGMNKRCAAKEAFVCRSQISFLSEVRIKLISI